MNRLLIIACSIALMSPAFAADRALEKVEERMSFIEQSLQDLQESVRQSGTDKASQAAVVEQIRADWNGYQGVVDAISQQQQLLMDQLQKYMDEFESRLGTIETNIADAGIVSDTPTTQVTTTTPKEQSYYYEGLGAIRDQNYDVALTSFQKYVRSGVKGPLTEKAYYWIAECNYALGNYQKSIRDFTTFVKRFPESENVSGAILKQGQAFAKLGMVAEAKSSYAKVVAGYPNTPIAHRAVTRLQLLDQEEAVANREVRIGN